MDLKAVGQRIKAAREAKNLTQEELAALVNLSTTHVSVIERGLKVDKFRKQKAKKRSADMVMALDELADILPDERYAPSRNDEEIGKSISIFLNKQKEVVRRVFLLKYFYFESNIAIAERCGFTERKVTHMLAHTGAQLKEYLIKEEIYL